MSAEIFLTSQPGGNDGNVRGTSVGGSKPLHRFLKGQPKIIGIVKLMVGSSLCIVNIAVTSGGSTFIYAGLPSGFLVGTLFIMCGIVYILTEHNPTKKTVTISLALSIVAILGACWTMFHMIPSLIFQNMYYVDYTDDDFRPTDEPYVPNVPTFQIMLSFEALLLVYTIVGGIIVTVMSCLAVAALRSTKSQAIIVMTTTADETPVQ